MKETADKLYEELIFAEIEVLYDDRNISAGIKFKDSDLIGIPLRLVIGKKYLDTGMIEVQFRKDGKKSEKALEEIVSFIEDFKTKNIVK